MTVLQALCGAAAAEGGEAEEGQSQQQQPLLEFMLQALVPAALTRAVVREDVLDADVGRAQAEVYAGLWREVRESVRECIDGCGYRFDWFVYV